MSARVRCLILVALIAGLLPRLVCAQPPPTKADSAEKPAEEPPEKPEDDKRTANRLTDEGNAPLFYFLARDGQFVLASNITYEDIQEFFDLKQGLRQQSAVPRYAIRTTEVRANVVGKVADITARVEFEVTADSEKPIAVPLSLGGLIRPQFQYRGEGKQFVVYDGQSYVCWIAAAAGSKHTMTITAVSPVASSDDAHRLSLALPFAPSRCFLDVPLAKAEFTLNDQRSSVTERKPRGRRTQATIDSRGGDLEIRWSPAEAATPSAAPLVFANTTLNVRIENQLLIRVDAEIEARAARGELSEFEVRLPAGIKLTQRRPTGYTVSDPTAAADGNARIVRVKLDTPAQRAPRIRLSGEITLPPDEAENPLEVWGFEVVGANQTGDITLLTGDDWVVTPVEGDNVRRDRSPPDAARAPVNAIRFTVVNQPCSLRIAVRPKLVRVVVDPTYQLDISPTKTELELRLMCRFGNGRPQDLELPLNGWSVSELLPDRLVGSDEFEIHDGKLTIPLGKLTDAPMGESEVIIRAELSHKEGEPLELPLPAPEVSKFSPGLQLVVREPLVIAIASNNIELTPDLTRMPNVSAENIDPDALSETWKTRQQSPIAYRADAAPLSFYATQQIRRRSVTATPNLTLDFESGKVTATQSTRFDVLYESLSRITFAAPNAVAAKDEYQVALNGSPLAIEDADESGFSVTLPESQLGEFYLTIQRELPLADVRAGESVTLAAPFLKPVGDEFQTASPTLRCLCPDNLRVELTSGENGWTEASTATRTSDKLEQLYTSAGSADSVSLQVRSAEVVSGSITVDRMWVQTWLTPSGRRERAVFRVSAPTNLLTIKLPKNAAADEVTVAANGFRIEQLQIADQRVQFETLEPGGKPQLIEVWYGFADPRSPIGAMDLEMPSIAGARSVNQFYWELITPRREHLFTHPHQLTAEMRWRRRGLTYGREALLTSQQLAAMFGAAQTLTPTDANRYLFSSLGAADRIQAHTMRRSWLVFMAAGAVMVIGAAWLALRGAGRSLFFLTAAVAIGSLATVYPNPAVVAAQAGFLGLACLMLGRLIRWAFWRDRGVGVEVRGVAPAPTTSATVASDARDVATPSTTRVHVTSESGA